MAQRELEQLMYRLNWSIDQGDADAVASLFTEDASMHLLSGDGAVLLPPITGRDQLRAFYAQALGEHAAQSHRQRHLVSNVMLETQGTDDATIVSYHTALGIVKGEPALEAIAWARDDCTLVDGSWKIACRKMYVEARSTLVTALAEDIVAKLDS